MTPLNFQSIGKYLLIVILIAGCNQTSTTTAGDIHEQRLLRADLEPENWMSLGRNFQQQHHSPLKQINASNADSIGLAWEYKTFTSRGKVNRGLEATPIVVDGVMYTSGVGVL